MTKKSILFLALVLISSFVWTGSALAQTTGEETSAEQAAQAVEREKICFKLSDFDNAKAECKESQQASGGITSGCFYERGECAQWCYYWTPGTAVAESLPLTLEEIHAIEALNLLNE